MTRDTRQVSHVLIQDYADPTRTACGRSDLRNVVTFDAAMTGAHRLCKTCVRVLPALRRAGQQTGL